MVRLSIKSVSLVAMATVCVVTMVTECGTLLYLQHLNPMKNRAVIELSHSFLFTIATVAKETGPK